MTTATVTIKGKQRTGQLVMWDEGQGDVRRMGSWHDSDGLYMGFVLRGGGMEIYYISIHGTRRCGVVSFDEPMKTTPAEAVAGQILEQYGISADVAVNTQGIAIRVQSMNSATTLLRKFMRFGCLLKASSANEFHLWIQGNAIGGITPEAVRRSVLPGHCPLYCSLTQ